MRKICFKSKRGFLQISFGWLFAIIVGGFILFLTIFAVTKVIHTSGTSSDAKMGKEIGVLLNPLETSFETGKTSSIILPVETRIYNKCELNDVFGKQKLQVSQFNFKKWSEPTLENTFYNKYIFSKKYVQGKKFYIFSKPFKFPFKVSDLIYITSSEDKYCFINSPDEVKEELDDLSQENLLTENCEELDDVIKVCFENANCDIYVNYNSNFVKKRNEKMYFTTDALMYAAIFSDNETYECQLKRLMNRTAELGDLYKDKAGFISSQECGSYINSDLSSLIDFGRNFENSKELSQFDLMLETIKQKNKMSGECRLW